MVLLFVPPVIHQPGLVVVVVVDIEFGIQFQKKF
jgi:hypothetical protein